MASPPNWTRFRFPWLALALGVTFTLALSWHERHKAATALQVAFGQLALDRVQLVQRELSNNLSDLDDTRRFCELLRVVTPGPFQEFTSRLAQRPGIQALEWAPRVDDVGRAAFEANARTEGPADFRIFECTAAGAVVPAGGRKQTFPVRFAEPVAGNERVIGFDLGSEPGRLRALELACDSGAAVVTERKQFIQEAPERFGFLIFLPVFEHHEPQTTVTDRRAHLRGFVVGGFQPGELIHHALATSVPRGLITCLLDQSSPTESQILYESRPRLPAGDPSDSLATPPLAGLRFETNFPFAGRQWGVVVQANRRFVETEASNFAWILLVAGLALSGGLAFYIHAFATAQHGAEELIHERTKALRASEADLAASRQRLAAIIAAEPECVKLVAADGKLLEMNPAGLKMIEADDAHQVTGQSVITLIAPESRAAFTRLNERVFRGETAILEFEIIGLKGTRRWMESHAVPLRDERGTIIAQLAVTRDVTARKSAEGAVHALNAYNRSLIEASLDPLVTIGPEGRITDVNAATESATGRTRAELIGTDFSDYFTEPAQARAGYQQVFQNGLVRDYPLELRHRDGSCRSVLYNASLYRDTAGKVCGVFAAARDITQRKVVEAELRRSEFLNRSLIEHLPQRVFIKNRDSVFVWCNGNYARDRGLPPEQVIGKSDFDFHPRELAEQYRAGDREAMTSDRPLRSQSEYRIEGRKYWINIFKVPYHDSHGTVVGVLGIFEDITEQKRLEIRSAALRGLGVALNEARQEQAAAQAVADAADQMWDWDACFLLRYDAGTEKVTELLDVDTFDGKRIATPISGEQKPASPLMRQVLATGPKLILRRHVDDPSPTTYRFGDISRVSMSLMFAPIHREGEKIGILSVQSYQRDAFNEEDLKTLQLLGDHCAGALVRVRAETELREGEHRFGTIFRASPVGIYLVKLADNRIFDLNDAMVRILGYSREEAIGHTTLELNSWVVPAERQRILEHVLKAGRIDEIEVAFRRKNGALAQLACSIEIIESGGQRCLLVFARDVTEFNRVQDSLRQAQKMESIGHLAGGVAHHFNNILAALTLNLSLWRNQSHDREQIESLDLMLEHCRGAGTLVGQLLAFGRKSMLQTRPCDLHELISGTCRLIRPLFGERIQLEFSLRGRGPWIHADRALIDQVLMNLCLNARDAMPDGGRLRLDLEEVEITQAYAQSHSKARVGRFARVVVADTGHGMDAVTLKHLFEPFFTTKDVGRGTGLGLATADGIVDQHKGWIEVESESGRGSTFRVYLPAIAPVASAPKPVPAALPPAGRRTVLLVEDEAAVRHAFCAYFRHLGYRVLEAADGPAARAVWEKQRHEIDLLFTDVVMPRGQNGWQLAYSLRSEKPSLKVILASGYSFNLAEFEKADAAQFIRLSKPFSPEDLTAALARCFA